MLDWLNNAVLTITDPLLGWLLALDRSVALFIVAGASAVILTLVRLVTTNQDLLRRCNRDRKQLKRLIKEAKARKDKDALQRHKATMVLIAGKKIKSEGLPLLAALVPILLLATWCFSRLGYHPLRADEPIQLSAYFPVSSVGKMMHVVPVSGLRAEDGWVQEVAPATYQGQPHGRASWTLRAEARAEAYELRIRLRHDTVRRRILVGQRTYEAPITFYPDRAACAEVAMREVKLFGVVPGIDSLLLPPWLVAYLLITIPLAALLKALLRIC